MPLPSGMMGAVALPRPYGILVLVCCVMILGLAACGSPPEQVLPTRVILPTDIPTVTPSPTLLPTATLRPTQTYTQSPTPSETPTVTPITPTLPPTETPTPTLTPTPAADAVVVYPGGAPLYTDPFIGAAPPLHQLDPQTPLYLLGKNQEASWYQVRTTDGQMGWVLLEFIAIQHDLPGLPVMWMPTPTPVPTAVVAIAGLSEDISANLRQIYQYGQTLGNRPNAFSKVGDSITAEQPFMRGFDYDMYSMGDYAAYQETVNFFRGSFARVGVASRGAFTAKSALNPMWATDPLCQPNETPIACEIRVHKPSIVFIMLGSADMQQYGLDEFRHNIRALLQYCTGQGVIPVLTSYPTTPEFYPQHSHEFNYALYRFAEEFRIPMIDLRTNAGALPDGGVNIDGFHLSERGDGFIDLNQAYTYGLTLRELMTLQVLDALRRGIPMQ